MSTNTPKLDAESARAARGIYNDLIGQHFDLESTSQCPVGTGEVKARYYGTAAWLIDQTLADVFTQIPQRGVYGLLTEQKDIVPIKANLSFEKLQQLMNTTITNTYDRLFVELSKKGYHDPLDSAYRSLVAFIDASQLYATSKGVFDTGPQTQIYAGISMATITVSMLLKKMQASGLLSSRTNLAASSKPLRRLAIVNLYDITIAQDETLLALDPRELFANLNNGTIDLSERAIGILNRISADRRENEDFPATIGCPVLFKPKQLQDLWQWGVNIALTAGLITPRDFQADR